MLFTLPNRAQFPGAVSAIEDTETHVKAEYKRLATSAGYCAI